MANILLTGATGFIGTNLSKHLTAKGHTVTHTFREDLYEIDRIRQLLYHSESDYIIHLAAAGNMTGQDQHNQRILTANIDPLFNILQSARHAKVKGVINFSTSSVLLPHQSLYSATKKAGEALCKAYADEYNVPVISVRPFSIYGAYEPDFRFIPTVFRSCLTGKPMDLASDATHDWLYVQNLCEAIESFVTQDISALKGNAYNLGTGVATSNIRVVELIQEITGKKATISKEAVLRSFDTTQWVCPPEDALWTMLGADLHTLEAGLELTYPYYKERYG